MDRFFNITNSNLVALNLFGEDTMQVLLTKVEEISLENQCLTKDRLYIKLQEIHNQKTGRDRTHIDAMMLFGKRRKNREYWSKTDYYLAMALFELGLHENMFEYWQW